MKLQFLGAAGQVTGSRYLLDVDGVRVLVDCGMFQERAYLDRNWEPSVVPPKQIDALLLTHAHVDHCGLVPKLVHEGFRGPIYATAATADLVAVVLRDAAKIQMEDAAFKQKRHRKEGRTGRYPVKPLFTEDDVNRTLPLLRPVRYRESVPIRRSVTAKFCDAGHILGSAMLEINASPDGQPRRLIFSGDVGQWDKPIIGDPSVFTEADYVVMESTYGNRQHDNQEDVAEQLARVIRKTVERGGNVIIPTFAIERAQELIYHLGSLLSDGRIPDVPIYLDSPMATEVTEVFRRHRDDFDADAWQRIAAGDSLLRFPGLRMVTSTEESKAINQLTQPGDHHVHLGHVYRRPHQAPFGTQPEAAGVYRAVRRLPGAGHAGPPDPRPQRGSPHPRPPLAGPRRDRADPGDLGPRRRPDAAADGWAISRSPRARSSSPTASATPRSPWPSKSAPKTAGRSPCRNIGRASN